MKAVLQPKVVFFAGDHEVWLENNVELPVLEHASNVTAYRVLNSKAAIRDWKPSSRASSITFAYRYILIPEDWAEAVKFLQSVNGAGIVFSDFAFESPFPFGAVWVNFNFLGARKAFAHSTCLRQCLSRGVSIQVGGYIGNRVYQDGSKFSALSPHIVVLARKWLRTMRREMNIVVELHSKDSPRG